MSTYVTNTQFAEMMRELRAIRASVERSEELALNIANGAPEKVFAGVTPENAARVLLEADPFEAVAGALRDETECGPLAGTTEHAKRRGKRGRR